MMNNNKAQGMFYLGMAMLVILIIALMVGLAIGDKYYKVWSLEKDGLANLKKAEWEKKIAIEEAKAVKESAILFAEAEIERAKGVAESNKIIGEGLQDNEEYLRYLWIQNLGKNGQDVIYIPTEAGMPILEAGKRGTE